uniref:Uncharacterized protein n=1 Tax=Oryza nivara TaxID=4536 RepID=A0A0E0IZ86_ORYNI
MLPLALPHLPFLLLTPPPSSSILIPLMIRLKKLKAVQERKNYGKSKAGDANSDEEGDTSGEDESNDDEV